MRSILILCFCLNAPVAYSCPLAPLPGTDWVESRRDLIKSFEEMRSHVADLRPETKRWLDNEVAAGGQRMIDAQASDEWSQDQVAEGLDAIIEGLQSSLRWNNAGYVRNSAKDLKKTFFEARYEIMHLLTVSNIVASWNWQNDLVQLKQAGVLPRINPQGSWRGEDVATRYRCTNVVTYINRVMYDVVRIKSNGG